MMILFRRTAFILQKREIVHNDIIYDGFENEAYQDDDEIYEEVINETLPKKSKSKFQLC